MVELEIDGQSVSVPAGTTIYDAAKSMGIDIPVLCHDPRLEPVGVCRMCVVDVGARVLAAACVRPCEAGMKVSTSSESIDKNRKMLTELLMADQPEQDPKELTTSDNSLWALASSYGLVESRFANKEAESCSSACSANSHDNSSPVIDVNHDACILCDRCIRACDDLQSNEVIGRTGKGYGARIAFDLDQPMGESSCVSCGECVAVCPTGALVNKQIAAEIAPREKLKAVDSVCPYCGVGCTLTYQVDTKENKIAYVDGRDNPNASQSRLCVKGRYGWDYSSHHQRLTKPLIRIDSAYPKGPLSENVSGKQDGKRRPGGIVDYDEIMPSFREASWDEALDLIANSFKKILAETGSSSLAGFGSAKGSNEEAYLFQKLIRAVFGTNNVDHCTRLCHASSVAALLEGIGGGAVTTTYRDAANSDVVLFTGTNTTANHPVAATFFKQAAKEGSKLIYVDPRGGPMAKHSEHFCQIKLGSDVAFYNAVMNVIIEEGLEDKNFIEQRTEGYEALKEAVSTYTPEFASKYCGIAPDEIREVARLLGNSKSTIIFWGMGISQHTHGTDNARCLIALALLTGSIGKEGTGLHPLRGQNNVQGASDAGLIPIVYPDYQSVKDPAVRKKFEAAWGKKLDPEAGLTVVEIMGGAVAGSIRGMYIQGENPFMSDPNVNKVRKGLSNLDFLVVQDIFLTETAEFADVVLPAGSFLEKDGTFTNTDRRVQRGRAALEMPGEARLDWKIIAEIATRMGYEMKYESAEEIFAEFASLTESYKTLSYDNLGDTGKLWPNPNPEEEDGPVILFDESFPTESGKAKFVPADFKGGKELPNEEYPFVLTTGRVLEHWHTGSMTRRAKALDQISPEAFVAMHPQDAKELGVAESGRVEVRSRRGEIELKVKISTDEQIGAVFIPFHFREASANLLTLDELDPYGKIPEFKFCAVSIRKL